MPSNRRPYPAGIRKRSHVDLVGLPLWEIAIGPDSEKGEMRGHAHAVIAIGDIATGWLAMGGLARGIVAIGGLALGFFSFGGVSVGLLAALGGLAIGGVALGGAAIGVVAVGGGVVGYYACGGGAVGKFIISAARRDPEAVEFFTRFLPFLNQ